jgi:hypothetical protein
MSAPTPVLRFSGFVERNITTVLPERNMQEVPNEDMILVLALRVGGVDEPEGLRYARVAPGMVFASKKLEAQWRSRNQMLLS